jgi:hypothetical protein
MAPLNEQPSDVGRSAVRKSGCGKSYQIGKEKRPSVDRTDQIPDARTGISVECPACITFL